MGVTDRVTSPLRERLLAARNADGGWGYFAGKASRLEATAWAFLALDRDVPPDMLTRWPAQDGLLAERPGGEPNYGFHGLALLTLLALRAEHERGNAALAAAIARVKGVPLEDKGLVRQNSSLQAWSWTAGTFSWVEPTAYCVLALKKARAAGMVVDGSRIEEGEAVLFDRCGAAGGWNYGNANVLGQELHPYVPTTALGLLALGDRRPHDAVRRSLELLERDALSEPSSVALSLALLALRIYGRPIDRVRSALVDRLPAAHAIGNLHALAMALFAVREDHDGAAFRV